MISKSRIRVLLCSLLGGTLLLSSAWGQVDDISFAEHTPGYRHYTEAMASYRAGQYASAKSKFKVAARWGDKLSQFNLGVMNYHGQGTSPNPARAWAWTALAAERGYPKMLDMADQMYRGLSRAQRREGRAILENELKPEFGDDVAIERTVARMERERRRATGSRTGFVGNLTVVDRSGRSRTGRDFYRAEAWDFRQVVEAETRLFKGLDFGVVTLRDVEGAETSADSIDEAEPES